MKIDMTEMEVGDLMTLLAKSDYPFAEAKGELESAKILQKRTRSRAFIEAEGTVAERQAEQELADDVQSADDQYVAALVKFEKIKAWRESKERDFDCWRTLEASRRRVNV
jgi:hypothetical protein